MSRQTALWALGAMSGTSLDGIDAALVLTDGEEVFEFGASRYRAYTDAERKVLRNALGHWDGPAVEEATKVVEAAHIEALQSFETSDIIGFHGQTLAHAPDKGQTLQAGNGMVLADALQTPVVWDFRTADMKLGGQGAPLAPFYHFALAKRLGFTDPVAFLNLGGVGNITLIDPSATSPEADGACLAFDTGPGNALIDDLCQQRTGARMDKDGALVRAGRVHEDILEQMMASAYFPKVPPKSLDRNDFSHWSDLVAALSDADAAATLAAGTARSVALALVHTERPPKRMLVTGGGRRNPGLMVLLKRDLPCPVVPVEDHELDGDMLEAQAFAYLAVRVFHGLPTSAPGTTGVAAAVGGGQVSRPTA
ncbi:MAG: anhydro-N-acetylmuramic acid kinase [Paracoccaceae bacterium]|nr:anhydro-N-acetylmuramic acid kinase [Paracoccaceae bacterium]